MGNKNLLVGNILFGVERAFCQSWTFFTRCTISPFLASLVGTPSQQLKYTILGFESQYLFQKTFFIFLIDKRNEMVYNLIKEKQKEKRKKMKNKIDELIKIIRGYDKLLDYWFDGISASGLSAEGISVYEMSDEYRNKALKILEELKEKC